MMAQDGALYDSAVGQPHAGRVAGTARAGDDDEIRGENDARSGDGDRRPERRRPTRARQRRHDFDETERRRCSYCIDCRRRSQPHGSGRSARLDIGNDSQ